MSSVTVLRCAHGRRATKRVTRDDDGQIRIEGYDAGLHFSVDEIAVAGARELGAVLDDTSRDPSAFIIRAEPLPGVDRAQCRRLLYQHEDGTPPDVPRCCPPVGDPRFRRAGGPVPIRSTGRRPGGHLLPHAATGAVAALLLLVGPLVFGRLQAWRADQAGVLARPARPRARTRAASQGLSDRRQHAPAGAADLRGSARSWSVSPTRSASAPGSSTIGTTRSSAGTARRGATRGAGDARARRPAVCQRRARECAYRRLDALCGAVGRAGVGGRHRCLIWAAARAVELDDAIPRERSPGS